jgi:hypothetical protein
MFNCQNAFEVAVTLLPMAENVQVSDTTMLSNVKSLVTKSTV